MTLDRILYRLLAGSWGRFAFSPGPIPAGSVSVPEEVGVYVHIPFCRSVCPFCPYNKVLYEPRLAARYSRCLEREVRRLVSGLGGAKVSSIYFGGGTPLTLSESVLSVVELLRPHLVPKAQVAVEAHPHDINPDTVTRLADAGVNMISLGVESLDDGVLRILGRNHSRRDALTALGALLDSGRVSVSCDIITGIPGQSAESSVTDMRLLITRGVDQVAAYPLMDFAFTEMKSRISFSEQRRLLGALTLVAGQAGYRRSSVWTWTRPGAPKYSSITRENYLGIGAGAASHVDRAFWVNTFDVTAYVDVVSENKNPVALSTTMSDRESALYRLFWRCYEGELDMDCPEAAAIPAMQALIRLAERLGLASCESPRVRLTEKGFFVYHLLERYYTRRYIGRLWQHCRQSAFPSGFVL